MTESDREAISKVLRDILREAREYDYIDAIRYWLDRLGDDEKEIVRQYLEEAVAHPSHEHWDLAVEVLSWFGWSNPARNAQSLAHSLPLFREGMDRYDNLLLALMNLRYHPVLPLVRHRIANCDHNRCRCAALIAHLAYLDSSGSVTYGAEWLSRLPEGGLVGDTRTGSFFTVYRHLNPSLLKELVDAILVRSRERGQFVARSFADQLDRFTLSPGQAETDRRLLISWMLKRAGVEDQNRSATEEPSQ